MIFERKTPSPTYYNVTMEKSEGKRLDKLNEQVSNDMNHLDTNDQKIIKDYSQLHDEELAKLTIEASQAFDELIIRYEPKLRRYLVRLTRLSKEDIDDVLQETFIKTYKNIASFDEDLKFSSWIYRIAHNEAISHLRKNKRFFFFERNPVETENGEEITPDFFVVNPTQAEDFDLALNKTLVSSTLKKLDQKYREVLILRYLEEKDYAEISDIIKKPPGTVATLLNRAKKQFSEICNQANDGNQPLDKGNKETISIKN